MSRLVSRAESWERVYNSFQNINFAAFDYNTVKQSLIDYIKLYFPETFNDYIESSEFIAVVETFAYIAEQIAYRLDVNAQENFISTAQRRDSILRLAKLVSYKADRVLPARGLVKITSVTTTEPVFDTNGINLSNTTVRWNDSSNPEWKQQFILLMNRVLEQSFGSVRPTDRFQIQDVVFELYPVDLIPLTLGVFPYSTNIGGTTVPMELVPVIYDSSLGIIERRPVNNANFTLLYGSDGLGDASDTTGFFCFTKQGTLQRFRTTFDGITPNQIYDVNSSNINETDVWLNNVDPNTGVILDEPSLLPYKRATNVKSGEWQPVDLAHAQNIIFNTNPARNKYEVETQVDDRVRLVFGDGEFADIPKGTFDVWVRTSLNENLVVQRSSIVNAPQTFTYLDSFNRVQTFTFTVSLISTLQNASAREDLEHIRTTAPAVYFTQDRMVNAEDYNVFLLQDSSILKLRALNRTFAGDSKYITWHDPSTTYENVKLFGDDAYLYFEDSTVSSITPDVDFQTLISTYLEPLLSSSDIFLQLVSNGVSVNNIRRIFTQTEIDRITAALTPPPNPPFIELYYNKVTNEWFALKESANPADPGTAPLYVNGLTGAGWNVTPSLNQFIITPLITAQQLSVLEPRYQVSRYARRTVVQSVSTRFWNTNDGLAVIDYDTLNSNYDKIVILAANIDNDRTGLLGVNENFNILSQEIIDSGVDLGLPDIHKLNVLSVDANGDGVPDNLTLAAIINPTITVTAPGVATVPISYIGGQGDVTVVGNINPMLQGVHWLEVVGLDGIGNSVNILTMNGNASAVITVKDYVYFSRLTLADQWVPAETSNESITSYIDDQLTGAGLWKRNNGRNLLNFAWFHFSPRYHLVDPAASNIIDMFVITTGYYNELRRALENNGTLPTLPTPLDLRTSYAYLLDNKMVSDTVILHPGKIKLLFGQRAIAELQATLKVIRSDNSIITDNQIKTTIVTTVRNFFDITTWEFGETYFFTEMAAAIHSALPTEISSVVLVPTLAQNQFGDMFEVFAREDEIFYADITVDNIEIVPSYNAINLRLNT